MKVVCAVCKNMTRNYHKVTTGDYTDNDGWVCGRCYGGMKKGVENLMKVVNELNIEKDKLKQKYVDNSLHSAVDNVFGMFT